MKKNIALLFAFAFIFTAFSQEKENQRVDEKIDELTEKWDEISSDLKRYSGLKKLCQEREYRLGVFHLLNEIHHYDSVVLDILSKKDPSDKEVKQTIKDINKLEKEFSAKEFISFMHEECNSLKEIEKGSSESVNGVGDNSYSSQTYVLETELNKYVKQTTNQIDKIRKHVHHLSNHYDE